jgi:hypothetical protein
MGQLLTTVLPAVVAGTPVTSVIGEIPTYEGTDNDFARVMLTAPSAVASPGGTNFATVTVRQMRAGSLVSNIAQLSLANLALAAEVPVNVPITQSNPSGGQSNDVLDVQVTHTGTGQALPAGCVVGVEVD